MKHLCLILAAAQSLAATQPQSLDLTRKGHAIIVSNVYLNHEGPFRMLVDTGNASSLIRPEIARRLRLTPAYLVERVTAAGSRNVPATLLDEVRTGSVSENGVEVMIDRAPIDGIDGVLGQTWLIQHDYLIDYRRGRLLLDPEPPPGGDRYGLRFVEGRPAIATRMKGEQMELVLDSGADMLVLDRTFSSGLLPLCNFSAAYISNREGFVVLVRHHSRRLGE